MNILLHLTTRKIFLDKTNMDLTNDKDKKSVMFVSQIISLHFNLAFYVKRLGEGGGGSVICIHFLHKVTGFYVYLSI